jgi:predicted dithiol-disulfide oxidoreductase (DUF899 family)
MRSEAMSYKYTAEKLADYRRQISELRQKMRDVQAAVEPEAVKDYTFQRAGGGSVRLSELFGDKADLFVIHNMGQSCPYCTLWADGFNGAYRHLSNRAAFVVSSPDTPEKQRKFAESRHWTFPMVHPSRAPVPLSPSESCPGFTTTMSGYDFRKAPSPQEHISDTGS